MMPPMNNAPWVGVHAVNAIVVFFIVEHTSLPDIVPLSIIAAPILGWLVFKRGGVE